MFSLAWCSRPEVKEAKFRFALGSFLEKEKNHIQVVEMDEDTKQFNVVAQAEHTFPPTKLMWRPTNEGPAQFASSCTALNIWALEDGQLKVVAKLANNRTQRGAPPGQVPPLTSFDWCSVNPQKIGSSSVDTTCTIWNVEKQKIETQLIAHDKAVYDIAFDCKQDSIFASVGADGSVRVFDQRNLDHSTIIYESNPSSPLLRLAWNKINRNHIATLALDAPGVTVVDIRKPSMSLADLNCGDMAVNHIAWAPHTAGHLLCGVNDGAAMIWNINQTAPRASAGTSRVTLR